MINSHFRSAKDILMCSNGYRMTPSGARYACPLMSNWNRGSASCPLCVWSVCPVACQTNRGLDLFCFCSHQLKGVFQKWSSPVYYYIFKQNKANLSHLCRWLNVYSWKPEACVEWVMWYHGYSVCANLNPWSSLQADCPPSWPWAPSSSPSAPFASFPFVNNCDIN